MQRINASIGFDKRLYAQDIAGSMAHARMLAAVGIIAAAERDAILAGLYLLDLRVQMNKPLSAIVRDLHEVGGASFYDRDDAHFPADQREAIVARVKNARPQEIDGLKVTRIDDTDGRKFYLEDGSWLLVRFSGTEPLLRIMIEGQDQATVQAWAEEIADAVRTTIA